MGKHFLLNIKPYILYIPPFDSALVGDVTIAN